MLRSFFILLAIYLISCNKHESSKSKSILTKHQLNGIHYFFNQTQSNNLMEAFKINSFPHYMIIDKNGDLDEEGAHLRPRSVREKINTLL